MLYELYVWMDGTIQCICSLGNLLLYFIEIGCIHVQVVVKIVFMSVNVVFSDVRPVIFQLSTSASILIPVHSAFTLVDTTFRYYTRVVP